MCRALSALKGSTMGDSKYRENGYVRVSYEYLHQLLRLPDELVIAGLDTSSDRQVPGTLTLEVRRGEWPPGFAGRAIGVVHDYTLGRNERIDDGRNPRPQPVSGSCAASPASICRLQQ